MITLAGLGALALAGWLVSLRWRDASVADLAWGPACALCAWVRVVERAPRPAQVVPAVLASAWAARLTGHLLRRRRAMPGEDRRYAAMRTRRGRAFAVTCLGEVFLFQALLAWFVASPLRAVATSRPRLAVLACGAALAIAGTAVEAVADEQLWRFRRTAPAGAVLRSGLWSRSRHPNYLGDAVAWWGMGVASVGAGAPVLTLAGPAVMSLSLRWFSGVPIVERSLRRRDGYGDYVATTPPLVPWRRRSGSSR